MSAVNGAVLTAILAMGIVEAGCSLDTMNARLPGGEGSIKWSDNGMPYLSSVASAIRTTVKAPGSDDTSRDSVQIGTPPVTTSGASMALSFGVAAPGKLVRGSYSCSNTANDIMPRATMIYSGAQQFRFRECVVTLNEISEVSGAAIGGSFAGTVATPDVHAVSGAFTAPVMIAKLAGSEDDDAVEQDAVDDVVEAAELD